MSAVGSSPPPEPADDGGPLSLPVRPAPEARAGVPWLASAVPVVGALGFWAFTGSAGVLWFALLGPVIAVAAAADGARTSRRARRRADADARAARMRVRERVAARHDAERSVLQARHPDVAGIVLRPELIWRGGRDAEPSIVVGRGRIPSRITVTAGSEHPDDLALAASARWLPDAPVVLTLAGGIALVGPAVLTRAVARALVLQVALALPPASWEAVGAPAEEEWFTLLPHARRGGGQRLRWADGARAVTDADLVVRELRAGQPIPAECRTVLTLLSGSRARVETEGVTHEVDVEAIALAQAATLARELAARADGDVDEEAELALTALRARERVRARHALSVEIGRGNTAPATVDLVADGPHAVVTGMTGSGKSELLVTWVTALSARYTTADVSFLLADFKGGTAFEPLRTLPHVTGVLTDLDERAAARAIVSLRAELRTREAALAQAGERDIGAIDLPRLVIVVDEFAALRAAHPDLEELFADIAARGRALGMHLILGTQRAAGVLRDGLLANCPLRISLRVADGADSSVVVGTADAADLPGDARGRGLAIIRRAADTRPSRARIARTTLADIEAASIGAGPRPRASWVPELPVRLTLAEIDAPPAGILLGLRDEPDRQRHVPWVLDPAERGLLVVGGPRSGKTSALGTIAAQAPRPLWIGADPEQAWDALVSTALDPQPGTVLLIDDLDALSGRLPDEYARAAAAAVEAVIRDAGRFGIRVFAAAQRLTGLAGRAAELFPRRVVLGMPSRAEHVAAGGEAVDFAPQAPPGRGVADRRTVQFALTAAPRSAEPAPLALWRPPAGLSGYVGPAGSREAIERWERSGVRVRSVADAGDPAVPPGESVILVGDPQQWLGHPRLLDRVRTGHVLVIHAACQRDLRLLTGERDLPPYADPMRGRGWEFAHGGGPRRIALTPSPAIRGS